MNHSKHVLFFGGITASLCVFGAIALAFAPGDNEQAINTLLGTALPAGIAAAAGAFQSGNREDNSTTSIIGTDKIIEADSYTLSQGKLQPNNSLRSQELMPFIEPNDIREDWVDEEYR